MFRNDKQRNCFLEGDQYRKDRKSAYFKSEVLKDDNNVTHQAIVDLPMTHVNEIDKADVRPLEFQEPQLEISKNRMAVFNTTLDVQ